METKKLTASYLFWKLIVRLLMLVMAVAFSALLYFVLNTGDLGEHVKMTVTAIGAFAVYMVCDWLYVRRSDLSHMKARDFILGESIVYALLTVVSSLILFAISGGPAPTDFSYGAFPFLPHVCFGYLFSNIFIGMPVQIAAFVLIYALLFLLKKKTDPALTGVRSKVMATAPIVEEQKEEGTEEKP